jgi:aldehyde:ferredoxin oxidoreductase
VEKIYGWTGRILKVDLTNGRTSELSTLEYGDRFLGGKGIASKIYWDEVSPETQAFAPENRLIFMTGPLAGP